MEVSAQQQQQQPAPPQEEHQEHEGDEEERLYRSDEEADTRPRPQPAPAPENVPGVPPRAMMGGGGRMGGRAYNTGPKGVLADYKEACRALREKRVQENIERWRKVERMAVGDPKAVRYRPVYSAANPDADQHSSDESDSEEEEEDEAIFAAYRLQRLQLAQASLPRFGCVEELQAHSFLKCVEEVHPATLVLVHLYKADNEACARFNSTLNNLAARFSLVHFCRMVVTKALPHYDNVGLPAVAIFRGGNQINSFVPITQYIGHRFTDNDVVQFLCQHKVLTADALAPAASVPALVDHSDSD